MSNLYHICLLRAFEHIHMEFARYKCLLLLLLLLKIIFTFHASKPCLVLGVSDPVDCDYPFTISLFSTGLYSIYIPAYLMHCSGNIFYIPLPMRGWIEAFS